MSRRQATLLLLSVNVLNVLAAPKPSVTSQRPMGLLVQQPGHLPPPTTTSMQQSTPTASCFRTDSSGSVWAYPTATYNHFDQAFCAGPSTAVPAATPLPEEPAKDDAELLERWKPNWCNHFPFMDENYNPWSLWALLIEYDELNADIFTEEGTSLKDAVARKCRGGVEEWIMRPSADYNSTMELNFSTREVCESGVSEALQEVSHGSLSVTCLGWHEFMQSRPEGSKK